MCLHGCVCVCVCLCMCVYERMKEDVEYTFYLIPIGVNKFYMYSAYVNVLQQLCDVRVFVDYSDTSILFFLYAEIMAAQLCVVKMYFLCPLPPTPFPFSSQML